VEHVGAGEIAVMRADRLEAVLEDLLREGITIYDVRKASVGR